MNRMLNIAIFTVQEVMQSRLYQFLLLALIFSPIAAYLLSSLFLVDVGKVYMDGLLGVLHFISLVFVIFVSSSMLARDIEHKVCYFFVVQPANRQAYLLGRFSGLIVLYYASVLFQLCAGILFSMLLFSEQDTFYMAGYSPLSLAILLFAHAMQYVALLGFVFFIASWATGLAEIVFFSLMAFIISWLLPSILGVVDPSGNSEQGSVMLYNFLHTLYQMLPHLNAADLGLMLTHGIQVSSKAILFYCTEHIAYAIVFVGLALWFFRRRDL